MKDPLGYLKSHPKAALGAAVAGVAGVAYWQSKKDPTPPAGASIAGYDPAAYDTTATDAYDALARLGITGGPA